MLMKSLLTKKTSVLLALLGTVIGYVIIYPEQIGICVLIGNPTCYYNSPIFTIGEPLFNFSVVMLITTFVVYFIRDEIFQLWLRFARWWIPLSVLIIAITPTTGHDWALGGPTREIMSWMMGGLFFFISLLIIAVKSWKLRGK